MAHTKISFGREVLGPIFAEFALRLWVYASNLVHPEDTALLFCARGGLRLQLLYERFLVASGLGSPVYASTLMVSRIVAVRPALLAGAASAYEQIGYEFSGGRLLDAAAAVGGIDPFDVGADAAWQEPYSRRGLQDLLRGDAGHLVLEGIQRQTRRFRAHLAARSGGRKRVVLCDTGLFGSTLQLLMDGMPDLSWSAVMIARANYKRLPAPHFAQAAGLSVEADHYCPWQPRTAMLRYWHLIESVLEPDLPSVNRFAEHADGPRSNLEVEGWQGRVLPEPDSIFAGVLDYLDGLPHAPATRVVTDAQAAWGALRSAVVWPRANEGVILDAAPRSVDFGRGGTVSVMRPWRGPLAALRGRSLWREGEIARSTSGLRAPLLLGIEAAYGLRWCRRNLHRLAG